MRRQATETLHSNFAVAHAAVVANLQIFFLRLAASRPCVVLFEARGCWGLEVIQSTYAECGYPRLTCLLPESVHPGQPPALGLSLALLGAAEAPRVRGLLLRRK